MRAGGPQEYGRYAGRRKGRRDGRSVNFLALLAVLCALILLIRGRIFVVREISVTGNSTRSDSEIAGQSGLSLGMNIFSVDKSAVERNLSANNYVELLEVHIEMPDTVTLVVRERAASAAVNCAGVILVVDQDGYILERLTTLPDEPDIVVVSGMNVSVAAQGRTIESGTAGQMDVLRRLLADIRAAQVQGLISELNVANPDNLYLVSESGIQVLLGDEEQLTDKLMWMQAVLEELTKRGVMSGVLDVSSGKNAVYADR